MPDITLTTHPSQLPPEHKLPPPPLSSGPQHSAGSLWACRFLCLPWQRPQPGTAQQERHETQSTLNSCNFLSLSCWILLFSPQHITPHQHARFARLSAFWWAAANWKIRGWTAASPPLYVSHREKSSKSDAITLLHLVLYRGKMQRKQCNTKRWTQIPACWAALQSYKQRNSKGVFTSIYPGPVVMHDDTCFAESI